MMIVDSKVVVEEEKDFMKDVRKKCEDVRQQYEKEVKEIIEDWLYKKFGYGKKPWRAIEGKKKIVRPIPFFEFECKKAWPNISKRLMNKVIEDLGFIIYPSFYGYETGIVLTIPEWKKGKKLTWAQEKIKKLNHDYSMYVDDEKRLAQFLFKEILLELSNYDTEKTEVHEDYTLFRNYYFGETMGQKSRVEISQQCNKFIKRLEKKNNMEAYYENDKYIGIRVFEDK